MRLEQQLLKFLREHLKENRTLLLALSGGPDSFALAHLLLEMQKRISFTFEVAHVDHSARPESLKEASILKKWAKKHQLIFHHKKLENVPSQNKEDFFRQKRYEFFLHLFQTGSYQAILFAHHQNDLEETVLKRILEGATFENLCSLKKVSYFQKMEVWRPLLNVSKSDILKYIERKELEPFIDPTNFDKSNLRSKMREEIIPNLEKAFGKNVRSNLVTLSTLSETFNDYLLKKVSVDQYITSSKLGVCFDLSKESLYPFELFYGLKKSLKERKIYLAKSQLLKAADWIHKKVSQKKIIYGQETLFFDRGRLLILPTSHTELPMGSIELKEGTYQFGCWQVRVEKSSLSSKTALKGWQHLFEKEKVFFIQLPYGEYFLRKSNLKEDRLFFGKPLSKFLQNNSVPIFLTSLLPVIENKEKIVAEFFTRKNILSSEKTGLNISLSYKKD